MDSEPEDTRVVLGCCPYLGLEEDRSSHSPLPTETHRCYAGPAPIAVDTERQIYYCLSGRFVLCPRHVLGAPEEQAEEGPGETGESAGDADPARSHTGERSWRTPVLVVAAFAALLSILAVSTLGNPSAAPTNSSLSSTSQVDSAAQPASSSDQALATEGPATPGALAAPATTNPPTSMPAPSPTSALGTALTGGSSTNPTAAPPSPVPAAQPTARTYVVPYGDTLTKISARFGVPIEEIMRANNIPDRNLILTGRTLVIPDPR